MTFDWGDYLNLSRTLHAEAKVAAPLEQSKLRCAASRAYYAAYWACRAKLEPPGGFGIDGTHGKVYSAVLKLQNKGPSGSIANTLKRLRQLREKADYEADTDLKVKEVDDQIFEADGIIKWSLKYLP